MIRNTVGSSDGGGRGGWEAGREVCSTMRIGGPEDNAASLAPCRHSPPEKALMSSALPAEVSEASDEFFAGCGEVKLCLLL